MSRLAIVIVSYNARADLERCLASLVAASPASAEIVVVDNASTDGSEAAARAFAGVQVIPLPNNRGFSAGNNAGIRATRSELILLLNSDTIVPPGAIDRLVAAIDRHPDVAIVGPRLVDGKGRPELSFGEMLGPIVELRRRRLMRALTAGDAAARAQVDALTRREQRPDWVTAACLLVRRHDAEAAGLLDERFSMYTEDVDFCASVRALGRGVLFTPDCEVIHLRGRSAAAAPAATRAAYERSHLAFYRKHRPLLAPLVWLYHRVSRQ
jgi:GT2 family glycosyltransferase